MDAAASGRSLAHRIAGHKDTATTLTLFAGTLFLSALLLFSVQPMFARMVLPKLGGSPSVWAVSMCFFQAVLLAGYCYAHALNRFVRPRFAPLVHLVLLGIAVLALPIGLPGSRVEPPAGDAYLWLVVTLALGVGLPFFAVSASAPLLQAWFARTGHPHANDPYFLYGASNLGSLFALLAYPVLFEPFAGLHAQSALWAAAFIVLGIAVAFCGLVMLVNMTTAASSSASSDHSDRAPGVSSSTTWGQRLAWIGLAAVPSGLLVAFSSYLSTDIASAPFLWVLPLAAFLATFILVFKERPTLSHEVLLKLQPALLCCVLFGLAISGNQGWKIACVAGTAAFFVTTLVAHRELFERRPGPEHLTEFYLWMSLGGVIGGVFAAIVAPQIFSSIWEFPLLLILGIACRRGLVSEATDRQDLRKSLAISAFGLTIIAIIAVAMKFGTVGSTVHASVGFLVAFAILTLLSTNRPARQLVFAAMMGLTMVILPNQMSRGDAERSFFGVHRVFVSSDKQLRVLMHGTTIHGAERIVDETGNKVTAAKPATYYYPGGPMARGVDAARVATGNLRDGLRVGVVGLGAGSMSCYSRSGEAWRFYEIDPVVVQIARDPTKFTFLDRCRPNADIVLGDARQTLTKEPAGYFHYLVIDAFSSDAIPVHLLTVEALQLYLGKLAPDGILALHVSNRHMDLVSVVSALTTKTPGVHAVLARDQISGNTFDSAASYVVFITKSEASMQPLRTFPYMLPMPEPNQAAWTDDYSNILTAIWRKYRG